MSGVYGIYIDDELVYIGSTTRTFEVRFVEHRGHMLDAGWTGQPKLYGRLRDAFKRGCRIELRPLVIVEQLKRKGKGISKRDVKVMELAFIAAFEPECNVEGIDEPYFIPYKEN